VPPASYFLYFDLSQLSSWVSFEYRTGVELGQIKSMVIASVRTVWPETGLC
jgi:hypothetical protein